MGPATRIQLCRKLEVELAGERVEAALPGKQGRLLFAYLVLHRERTVRRDELLEVLWSDDGAPAAADALLSAPLSRLRKVLGPERLQGRSELTLVLPATAWIDWEAAFAGLQEAHTAVAAGRVREAVDVARAALEIAQGGLLPGLEAGWIDAERAALEDLRLELLELVATAATQLGGLELPYAEQAARAAVEASPFRESARAALIEVLRARGNVADALRVFEDARTLLREELGATPGPLLLDAHARLLRSAPAPVPTSSPLPDRLAAVLSTPLIGRVESLGRLRAALRSARDGETAAVLVVGEGGIGKTRLIAELARTTHDFNVLYGRCDEHQLFPFGPWIELLGTVLDRADDDELATLLAGDGPQLARLLPELRGRISGLDVPDAGDPASELRHLYGAVVSVLQRLSGRTPLIAIIDDLHWADRSSLLLCRHVVRAIGSGPVLLVGTYRDTDLDDEHPLVEVLADLEREGPLTRIRLGGLDAAEIGAVAAAEGRPVAPETAGAIREQTDGNPFFVRQVLRALDESQDPRTVRVTAGLRDVILRRVARLGSEAARMLRVAALLGREFDLRLLVRILDRPEDDLLDDLDAAVAAGILWEVANTPGRYAFVHALVRTALEQELTAARRAHLHRRIGEAIEARYAGSLDPWLEELTRHFGAAGAEETARAVDYAIRAAEQATSRLAYAEAAAFLAAFEHDDRLADEQRGRLLHDLGLSRWRLGHAEDARNTLERAAEAARRAGAAALFARAALGHAASLWVLFGNEDPASAHLLEEALALLPETDAALRAQVLARLGSVLYFSTQATARGASLVESAIAMAHRVQDDVALATALSAALFVHWRPYLVETRIALADELLQVAERSGTLEQVAEAWLWRVGAFLTSCRRDESDLAVARHAEIARRVDQPELLTHSASLRTMQLLLDGRWDEAEQTTRRVLELGEHAPLAQQEAIVAVLVLRGEQLRLGELAEELERHARHFTELPAWNACVIWAYVQGGRIDEARAKLETLRLGDYAALPRDVNFEPGMAMLAHVAAELGDSDLAAEIEPHLRPSAEYWIVYGIGASTLGPAAYSLGLCSLLAGRNETAIDDFELALAKSRQMRCRPYEGHSCAGLARALETRAGQGDPERAAGLRAAAVAIAEELDMPRLLRDAGYIDSTSSRS